MALTARDKQQLLQLLGTVAPIGYDIIKSAVTAPERQKAQQLQELQTTLDIASKQRELEKPIPITGVPAEAAESILKGAKQFAGPKGEVPLKVFQSLADIRAAQETAGFKERKFKEEKKVKGAQADIQTANILGQTLDRVVKQISDPIFTVQNPELAAQIQRELPDLIKQTLSAVQKVTPEGRTETPVAKALPGIPVESATRLQNLIEEFDIKPEEMTQVLSDLKTAETQGKSTRPILRDVAEDFGIKTTTDLEAIVKYFKELGKI